MHLIYLDESGNSGKNLADPQQPVFVLCGLIVHEDKWLALEKDLQAAVIEMFPGDRPERFEVHAEPLKNGKGFFKGFPLEHRLAFRNRWLGIATRHGLKVVYRAIVKRRFQAWIHQSFGTGISINPYVAAFPLVAQVINDYLKALASRPLGIFISDDNAEVVKDVEKSLKVLRGIESSLRLDQIIEKGFFIDSKTSLPLQLCDLVAYSVRKKEEGRLKPHSNPIDLEGVLLIEPLIYRGNEQGPDVIEWLKNQQNSDQGHLPGVG